MQKAYQGRQAAVVMPSPKGGKEWKFDVPKKWRFGVSVFLTIHSCKQGVGYFLTLRI